MNIQGARILITGGSAGIGYETAKLLREEGAEVVICSRSEEGIQKAAEELDVHGIAADVSREEDVEKLFAFALEKLGGLDVLVNNAGVGFMGNLVDTPVAELTRIWEINTKSTFLCGQKAAQHFIEKSQPGNIINIASMGAVNGFAGGSAYASSKAAITGLTMCWRQELRKHNIRVMQVNPSEVVTEFAPKLGIQQTDNGRKLHGEEIAQAIAGLLRMNDKGFIPDVNVWATNPF